MGRSKPYPTIIKSPLDKKEYLGIELENKMKVLLISDPLTEKSAASLSVAVGSMCDPENLPGLAHFCEHMLFLGTKKYEADNEYSKFLSGNAGSSNAYTAKDHTNFYFDVGPKSLIPALDRFSQFFISPLFTETCTEREVNAVHSEHEKNLTDDAWRSYQLDIGLTNPAHPFSQFATGNRETLWEIPRSENVDVRNALIEFHKKYYSANLMNLCVLGSETLEKLQEIVEEMFSEVENRDIETPRWQDSPYSKEFLGKRIEIVPIEDERELTVTFSFPDTTMRYKSSDDYYLSHLIGHEGPGSLLSLLKSKNWVTYLNAGSTVPARGFGLFKICVDLTAEGIRNVDEITVHIFQYLKMLSETGPQKWVWEEIRDIYSMMFRFRDKEEPQSLVSRATIVMDEIPIHEVFSARYILTDYDPEYIKELLNILNPENCRIMITAQEFADRAVNTEKWYNVKYNLNDIPEYLIERWKNCDNHPELALPPINDFIPTEFTLKPREPDTDITPTMVDKNEFQKLWFLQDNEFDMPKAYIVVQMYSNLPMCDPLYSNLMELYSKCVEHQLTEYSYSASLAGLYYDISATIYGLEISISGYDHKMPTLLLKVLDRILNFKPDAKQFEVLKENLTRELKNFEKRQPYLHSSLHFAYLLQEKRWRITDLIEALEGATVESIISFVGKFLSKTKLEWLACGNLSYNEIEDLSFQVESMFAEKRFKILLPAQTRRLREVNLRKGINYVYCTQHPTHLSSCAAVLFQTGLQSDRDNVLLELIAHICEEPCFHQLRTTEQLGYIVETDVRRSSGTQGLLILVQSDKHPPFLETRIDDFIKNFQNMLQNMSEEKFLALRNSLYIKKSEKPKTISDRSLFIWNEIFSQEYNFDRQNIELQQLETVTMTEIIEYFTKYIALESKSKKKLSIYITSNSRWMNKKEDIDELNNFRKPSYEQEQIIDVEEWKKTQKLYPVGKCHNSLQSKPVLNLIR